MSEPTSGKLNFKNSVPDWILRLVIFSAFLFFGSGKFKSDTNAPWVVLFNEIGFGQWFRYFTGVVEMIGAFLVLIPQTVTAGLAVVAGTLTCAIVIQVAVLHRFADTFVPFALLCAVIAFWMHRRRI